MYLLWHCRAEKGARNEDKFSGSFNGRCEFGVLLFGGFVDEVIKMVHETIDSFFQIPDLKDTEAMQRFFLQEVQLGEELLAQGM